ncbi:PD-(D/E)XK nuclease family transposase, partial [Segatella copri]
SKFNKPLEELDTLYEKWLYALKNLYKLTQRPKELCDKVFDRLFEEAEIAKFTPQEMREYETSKMAYRDIKNSVDTAKREGIAEGMEKGMKEGMELGIAKGKQEGLAEGMEKGMNQKALEIAKNMLAMGLSAEQVAKATQLPLDIIKNQNNS